MVAIKSEDLHFHSLKAISPIDGRHRVMTAPLAEWFSEYALFKYRLKAEVEYLIALSELPEKVFRSLSGEEKQFLRQLVVNFSLEDAQIIQNIDRFGYKEMRATNHDAKAGEYFLKMKMSDSSLKDLSEAVHFGLTSEDINNLAYNWMLKGGINNHYLPALVELLDNLSQLADEEKSTSMLGRTHGQPATPTTFGKEMAVFLERLRKEILFLQGLKLPAKLNGAVGNHAAQHFAVPEADWLKFSENFLSKLGFEANLLTTQIEPHDGLTKIFSSFVSINNILRDLALDLWLYTSQDYLIQEKIEDEVGSSTMPHKINPWRLEVGEGSTIEANAKLQGFIGKLQNSRLQRDLSDHEAQRAMGVGISHSYLAVVHLKEEAGRLKVNREKMITEVQSYGSILTEAVQTYLRRYNYSQPYELMKDFSRGRHCSLQELHDFIDKLEIGVEHKQKLKSLKPENYIGLSVQLTELAVKRWAQFKENYEGPNLGIKKIIFDANLIFTSAPTKQEKELLLSLSSQGLEVFGLKSREELKNLFTKVISLEEMKAEKGVLFVGKYDEQFRSAQELGMVCVNYGFKEARSEYNIYELTELKDLVNALQK